MAKTLTEYRHKRDFKASPEPVGKSTQKRLAKQPVFVIHKHKARNLHFDFRIEVDGVLTSWAIPKGPSTNPSVKRLAIPTEDHPMDYAQFEGVIPAGNYGAGTVMVWDIGTFKNIKTHNGKIVPLDQCVKNGTIELWLEGKKLHGGYALIKTKTHNRSFWLLLKMNDQYANKPVPAATAEQSALTGRTMQEIAEPTPY